MGKHDFIAFNFSFLFAAISLWISLESQCCVAHRVCTKVRDVFCFGFSLHHHHRMIQAPLVPRLWWPMELQFQCFSSSAVAEAVDHVTRQVATLPLLEVFVQLIEVILLLFVISVYISFAPSKNKHAHTRSDTHTHARSLIRSHQSQFFFWFVVHQKMHMHSKRAIKA